MAKVMVFHQKLTEISTFLKSLTNACAQTYSSQQQQQQKNTVRYEQSLINNKQRKQKTKKYFKIKTFKFSQPQTKQKRFIDDVYNHP